MPLYLLLEHLFNRPFLSNPPPHTLLESNAVEFFYPFAIHFLSDCDPIPFSALDYLVLP